MNCTARFIHNLFVTTTCIHREWRETQEQNKSVSLLISSYQTNTYRSSTSKQNSKTQSILPDQTASKSSRKCSQEDCAHILCCNKKNLEEKFRKFTTRIEINRKKQRFTQRTLKFSNFSHVLKRFRDSL